MPASNIENRTRFTPTPGNKALFISSMPESAARFAGVPVKRGDPQAIEARVANAPWPAIAAAVLAPVLSAEICAGIRLSISVPLPYIAEVVASSLNGVQVGPCSNFTCDQATAFVPLTVAPPVPWRI